LGVKNATFQESWGLFVNQAFRGNQNKQNPRNLNVVFNVFAFWGSEAKLFPYIPNIHRFFWGVG